MYSSARYARDVVVGLAALAALLALAAAAVDVVLAGARADLDRAIARADARSAAASPGALATPGEIDSFQVECATTATEISPPERTWSLACVNTSTTEVAIGDDSIAAPASANSPVICDGCTASGFSGPYRKAYCRVDSGTVDIECTAVVLNDPAAMSLGTGGGAALLPSVASFATLDARYLELDGTGAMAGDLDVAGNDLLLGAGTGRICFDGAACLSRLLSGGAGTVTLRTDANGTQAVLDGDDGVVLRDNNADVLLARTALTTNTGPVLVDHNADSDALTVQGHSTMSAGSELLVLEQSDGTDVFTVDNDGGLVLAGGVTSTASTVGSIQTAANQACATTCSGTGACLPLGYDSASPGVYLSCSDATADVCVCLGQ